MAKTNGVPTPNRWYNEFESVRQLWIGWCDENITRFDSVWPAWQAFLEDLQNHQIQLYELKPEQLPNRSNPIGSLRDMSEERALHN